MSENGIGASPRRKEDQRFLTGKGRYVDDITLPGQTYAAFVRSPHASATIKSIDSGKATSAAGVIAVLTGADLSVDGIGGMPCGWGTTDRHGEPMNEPAWPVIAADKVNYVGDIVAMVIADSVEDARAATLAVVVDYDVHAAIVATGDARKDGSPQVHPEAPGNLCFDWELGDKAATDAAFEAADHVTTLEIVNQRVVPLAIEPRASNATYDSATDELTLYCTSQAPHVTRLMLGAFVLQHPEHKFRVVSPDVGGGFGSKIYPYPEYAAQCWAAKRLGIPIKWTADRSEAFLTDAHGRDHVSKAQLALSSDGTFLGLRVHTVANMGAYLSMFAPLIPTFFYATLLAGQYRTPAIHAEVKAVFTNTTPVDAVRGAGRPEATYVLERVIDAAAFEMKIDPAELRRMNMIAPDAFPYQTPVALVYDSGDYENTLDVALKAADYAGFEARRATAKANGKLRGIGISTPIEATGAAPSAIAGQLGARAGLYESALIRFNATGSVTVFVGTHSHGQGHETTYAQLIATKLGVPFESIEIAEGDTARGTFGMGSYGSRSIAVGGSAIALATDKIIAKGKKISAHLMEADEGDIEFSDGNFTVSGTDKVTTIAEVAFAAYVPHNYPLETVEPGLEESAFYDPSNFNFPFGAYICEVEIDAETGTTEIVKFTVVDDVGNIINPMIVDGQVHGGVTHGIGQALHEAVVYDDAGQLLTGSPLDYALPRADDVLNFDTENTVTPCPHNPLGVKGVGEIGAIGAPPAVISAVANAIGVRHIEMPATPQKIWRAIQDNAA